MQPGWADERVETLKKLWADGLSANQIAGRLGGVTRNAVIGKVHRLGLSGRATTSRMKSRNFAVRRKCIPGEPGYAQRRKRFRGPIGAKDGAAGFGRRISEARLAELAALKDLSDERCAAQLAPDLIIPQGERKTLLDLEADSCRWPFGDPKQPDFHFCNGTAEAGLPYCKFHTARAYRPPVPRVHEPRAFKFRGMPGDQTRALDEFMERA